MYKNWNPPWHWQCSQDTSHSSSYQLICSFLLNRALKQNKISAGYIVDISFTQDRLILFTICTVQEIVARWSAVCSLKILIRISNGVNCSHEIVTTLGHFIIRNLSQLTWSAGPSSLFRHWVCRTLGTAGNRSISICPSSAGIWSNLTDRLWNSNLIVPLNTVRWSFMTVW